MEVGSIPTTGANFNAKNGTIKKMTNNVNIQTQSDVITNALLKMQEEMDALAAGATVEDDLESVIGDKKLDAVLVQGDIEFRPTTQSRTRMTYQEVERAMDELSVVLEKLGVTVNYTLVKAVTLD